VADIVDFRGKKIPEGMRPAAEGDTGMPEVFQALAELQKMAQEGKLEGMVVVGVTKDNDSFGSIAGLISPVQMAGILESVKLQILLG
jgi:hypothetical protein